jgi:parallel beta-helix repeat protein
MKPGKQLVSLGFLFVFLLVAVSVVNIEITKAESKTIVVPDDYSSIQEAVGNAFDGDTVFVRSGFYYNQTVIIDKRLSLIGEDKTNTRIIGDWSLNGTVVLVLHDGVVVQNLTLCSVNNSGLSGRGVHLLNVRGCLVLNCNSLNNGIGVWLYGSSENTIEDNYMISENTIPFSAGIKLQYSHNNSILWNNAIDYDYGFGIVLDFSNGNNLTGNQISNNYHGIWLNSANNNDLIDNNVSLTRNIFVRATEQVRLGSFGIRLFSSANNTIASNNVSSVPKGIQIVAFSYLNLVENNTITNSTYGLELANNSSRNLIERNKISISEYGLMVKYASNNTLSANKITDNLVGANFEYSSENLVYHNNFIKNTIQIYDNNITSKNTWDNGSEGNYWSNYKETDNYSNGIGDTPYVIDENNQDNYPFINPIDIETIPEFSSWIILPLTIMATLIVIVIKRRSI